MALAWGLESAMLRPRVRVIRALSFVLAACALAGVRQPAVSSLWSPSLAAQAQTATPSPEQFFGYRMGADRKLATWDRLLEYYRTVAQVV